MNKFSNMEITSLFLAEIIEMTKNSQVSCSKFNWNNLDDVK